MSLLKYHNLKNQLLINVQRKYSYTLIKNQ